MDVAELIDVCLSQPHAVYETPFGPDTAVIKVAGKIFALIPLDEARPQISLKAMPEKVLALLDEYEAATPAPYMNKNHWVRLYTRDRIPAKVIRDCIETSYNLVRAALPKKTQDELGKLTTS